MWMETSEFSLYIISVNICAIASVCMYFLNMYDIILVSDNIIILLN